MWSVDCSSTRTKRASPGEFPRAVSLPSGRAAGPVKWTWTAEQPPPSLGPWPAAYRPGNGVARRLQCSPCAQSHSWSLRILLSGLSPSRLVSSPSKRQTGSSWSGWGAMVARPGHTRCCKSAAWSLTAYTTARRQYLAVLLPVLPLLFRSQYAEPTLNSIGYLSLTFSSCPSSYSHCAPTLPPQGSCRTSSASRQTKHSETSECWWR
mmetsp:Transcript_731/g.2345  ORF Transcript_731/g.2345 Transcript_731/m.2345 type:complete len:207 (+) Transcript_731:742-1362(+)